ncbi:Lrp/AsnC family transcriptional regulator [Streptomyces sp. NPDC051020]|uniref:Lrp/AsnC family transcriptional regulator n=1 Tax=Streptomyces sp. NPDC051020 TaxID=3155409 RepID=UPI0034263EF8
MIPCSNNSAACIRTDSRRSRPAAVSPPPSAYLTHHGIQPPRRTRQEFQEGSPQRAEVSITGYRAVVDPAALGLHVHAVIRLRTTHAQLSRALDLASRTPEIASTLRVTGEDCLILDVYCPQAGRLEEVVDALARYGPVTTSLVLRAYPPKPLTDAGGNAGTRRGHLDRAR